MPFGEIRPDLIGYCGEQAMLIEITNTSQCTSRKLEILERDGLWCLEIDVSSLSCGFSSREFNRQIWREPVLGRTHLKRWLQPKALPEAPNELPTRLGTDSVLAPIPPPINADLRSSVAKSASPIRNQSRPYRTSKRATRTLLAQLDHWIAIEAHPRVLQNLRPARERVVMRSAGDDFDGEQFATTPGDPDRYL